MNESNYETLVRNTVGVMFNVRAAINYILTFIPKRNTLWSAISGCVCRVVDSHKKMSPSDPISRLDQQQCWFCIHLLFL